MTTALDVLVRGILDPPIPPSRLCRIMGAQIQVREGTLFRDIEFRGCDIYCEFPINGPGNGSDTIVKVMTFEEAYSAEFLATFERCSIIGSSIKGIDAPDETSGESK